MEPTGPKQTQQSLTQKEAASPDASEKGRMANKSVVASDAESSLKKGTKRDQPESGQVTDRTIGQAERCSDFYRSSTALFEAFFDGDRVKPQPFRLYSIGGSDMAASVSRAPGIDAAAMFWHEFEQSGCRVILNINHDGEGEEYYPYPNQILNLQGLNISREDIQGSHFLAACDETALGVNSEKRSRSNEVNSAEHMTINISGKLSCQTELCRIKNWQDGEGYDPHCAIAIARTMPFGETLVHCRAGLGRTGTMVAIMQLVDLADHNLLVPEKAVDTLAGFILGNRYDRDNNLFVSTVAQFNSLLQVVQILTGLSAQDIDAQVQAVIKARSQP